MSWKKGKMDEAAKKTTLRYIPYGLFVVGTKDDTGKVNAFAANWLTQTSFKPPLVVMAAKADAPSTAQVEQSKIFCVNVIESGGTALASKFFGHVEPEGNKFGDVEFSLSPNGCPVLKDALGYFECRLVDKLALGDHTILVGEVVEAAVQKEGAPLTLKETGFNYGG
jgi:flavin reductase (DIM6/NTAB) family NADH-FMN oxidoreductase RutF